MSKLLRVLAIGLIPVLLLGCGDERRSGRSPLTNSKAGQSTEAPPLKEPLGKPVATLDAATLWQEFGANALQADSKYKGKVLKVTGTVRTVEPNESGRNFVGFEVFPQGSLPAGQSDQQKKWFNEGYPPLVICYLDPAGQSKFEEVKKGQGIAVLGRCVGRKKDPSGFKDYIVVLEDCRMPKAGD